MNGKIYTGNRHRFWSAVALIAGMSIGASELGLPVVLRFSGYLPAVVGMFAMYICMLASGILLSRLFMAERERDLPALFHKYLGKGGALLFNTSYFALAFCLLVAYWSGLHGILRNLNVGLPATIMIGILVYYGLRSNLKFLCGTNFALTIGLIISFILIVVASLRGKGLSLLSSTCWSQLPKSLPIILCSYGYHQVIPMVCEQLGHDARSINRALLC
jgi:tyrosine-specific transport protein